MCLSDAEIITLVLFVVLFVLLPSHKARLTPNCEAVSRVALYPQTERLHVLSL